jgi:hypothetical protein
MQQGFRDAGRGSWVSRARAVGVATVLGVDEPTPESPEATPEEVPAWDPFEVWLHRIHRPRQRRETES